MTAHDPELGRESRGFLGWLGFGPGGRAADPVDADEDMLPPASADPRERRRRQLLDDVGSFLMAHRLEINPYTLAIAHAVITGGDQRLARQIEDRVAARKPVTLDWLEEVGRRIGRNDGAAQLDALMQRLEESLEEFTSTTRAARSATQDYNSALEAHVGELQQVSKAGVMISELATIAKVMLERTREIETDMHRSEMQTMALQSSLEEARRNAEMDHLTGLPNRRAFENVLEKEIETAKAIGEPLCVAFCDIDNFKRVNDTHGHEAGDRVLRAVAQTLARISDDRCHVARHGGEEFVVLLRGKTIDEAWRTLDEARGTMADRRLVNRATDVPFGRITFSCGVADLLAYPGKGEALKAADDALYDAKNSGRNCVIKASSSPPEHA